MTHHFVICRDAPEPDGSLGPYDIHRGNLGSGLFSSLAHAEHRAEVLRRVAATREPRVVDAIRIGGTDERPKFWPQCEVDADGNLVVWTSS